MKNHHLLSITSLFIFLMSACSPSIQNNIKNIKEGEAIIQYENGKYSVPMPTRMGFEQLKSNEKLFLGTGRVKFTEPLLVENIDNIQIIGNNTALVAKIDMPVIQFKNTSTVKMSGLLVVHEIGEWCAQNCVEFYSSSNINIQNCKFDGSGFIGLALSNVRDALIENNQFFNCEYGLSAWKCTTLEVKSNSFRKNRAENIKYTSGNPFTNDVETDNTFE